MLEFRFGSTMSLITGYDPQPGHCQEPRRPQRIVFLVSGQNTLRNLSMDLEESLAEPDTVDDSPTHPESVRHFKEVPPCSQAARSADVMFSGQKAVISGSKVLLAFGMEL